MTGKTVMNAESTKETAKGRLTRAQSSNVISSPRRASSRLSADKKEEVITSTTTSSGTPKKTAAASRASTRTTKVDNKKENEIPKKVESTKKTVAEVPNKTVGNVTKVEPAKKPNLEGAKGDVAKKIVADTPLTPRRATRSTRHSRALEDDVSSSCEGDLENSAREGTKPELKKRGSRKKLSMDSGDENEINVESDSKKGGGVQATTETEADNEVGNAARNKLSVIKEVDEPLEVNGTAKDNKTTTENEKKTVKKDDAKEVEKEQIDANISEIVDSKTGKDCSPKKNKKGKVTLNAAVDETTRQEEPSSDELYSKNLKVVPPLDQKTSTQNSVQVKIENGSGDSSKPIEVTLGTQNKKEEVLHDSEIEKQKIKEAEESDIMSPVEKPVEVKFDSIDKRQEVEDKVSPTKHLEKEKNNLVVNEQNTESEVEKETELQNKNSQDQNQFESNESTQSPAITPESGKVICNEIQSIGEEAKQGTQSPIEEQEEEGKIDIGKEPTQVVEEEDRQEIGKEDPSPTITQQENVGETLLDEKTADSEKQTISPIKSQADEPLSSETISESSTKKKKSAELEDSTDNIHSPTKKLKVDTNSEKAQSDKDGNKNIKSPSNVEDNVVTMSQNGTESTLQSPNKAGDQTDDGGKVQSPGRIHDDLGSPEQSASLPVGSELAEKQTLSPIKNQDDKPVHSETISKLPVRKQKLSEQEDSSHSPHKRLKGETDCEKEGTNELKENDLCEKEGTNELKENDLTSDRKLENSSQLDPEVDYEKDSELPGKPENDSDQKECQLLIETKVKEISHMKEESEQYTGTNGRSLTEDHLLKENSPEAEKSIENNSDGDIGGMSNFKQEMNNTEEEMNNVSKLDVSSSSSQSIEPPVIKGEDQSKPEDGESVGCRRKRDSLSDSESSIVEGGPEKKKKSERESQSSPIHDALDFNDPKLYTHPFSAFVSRWPKSISEMDVQKFFDELNIEGVIDVRLFPQNVRKGTICSLIFFSTEEQLITAVDSYKKIRYDRSLLFIAPSYGYKPQSEKAIAWCQERDRSMEMRRLKRENTELKREIGKLKAELRKKKFALQQPYQKQIWGRFDNVLPPHRRKVAGMGNFTGSQESLSSSLDMSESFTEDSADVTQLSTAGVLDRNNMIGNWKMGMGRGGRPFGINKWRGSNRGGEDYRTNIYNFRMGGETFGRGGGSGMMYNHGRNGMGGSRGSWGHQRQGQWRGKNRKNKTNKGSSSSNNFS